MGILRPINLYMLTRLQNTFLKGCNMGITDRLRKIQEEIDSLKSEAAELQAEEKRFSEMSEEQKEEYFERLQQWIDDKELEKDFGFKPGTVAVKPREMEIHRGAKRLLKDQKASDYAEAVKIILKTMK